MSLNKQLLYLIIGLACILSYTWLYINLKHKELNLTVCLVKGVAGVPCPSCGSTRSVLELIKGNLTTALHINPLGYLILLAISLTPLWLIYDLALNKSSLFHSFKRFELFLVRKKNVWITLLLIGANWIWNIYKAL